MAVFKPKKPDLKPEHPNQSLPDRVAVCIATGFGIGLIPFAPGTWGSLLGIAAGVIFHSDHLRLVLGPSPTAWIIVIQMLILVSMTAIGIWSIHRTEAYWGEHDSGKIVWDEILGQMLPVMVSPLTPVHWIAAFIIFRILDIWKPGPIGWADRRLPGAWGTLCDDVIAGLVAALLMIAAQRMVI